MHDEVFRAEDVCVCVRACVCVYVCVRREAGSGEKERKERWQHVTNW